MPSKKYLEMRGGLSVRQYARNLAEENSRLGYLKIRNLRSAAKRGFSIDECYRISNWRKADA